MGIEVDGSRATAVLIANVHLDANAVLGNRGDSVATRYRVMGYCIVAPTAKVVGAMDVPKDHALDYLLSTETDFDAAIGISHERFHSGRHSQRYSNAYS